MKTIDPKEALLRAAATFMGFSALARKLGVTPQAVGNWYLRGRVPAERVLQIEKLTGVSRHLLRPDVFGPAPVEVAE